jgi:hypothetical protein
MENESTTPIEPRMLGRNPSPPCDLDRRLRMASYDAGLPEPPPVVNGYRRLSRLTKAGNDRYGSCVFAAACHNHQVWTANEGPAEIIWSDADVIRAYFGYTGGMDVGANLAEVLKVWQHQGICGDKIGPYVAVDPRNTKEIMQAIAIFGGLFAGMVLPSGWYSDLSHWSLSNTGRGSAGGHCVTICSYDQARRQYGVYTWGRIVPMDFDALSSYFDELDAILSPDWYADGIAPNGLDAAALRRDLEIIGTPREILYGNLKSEGEGESCIA